MPGGKACKIRWGMVGWDDEGIKNAPNPDPAQSLRSSARVNTCRLKIIMTPLKVVSIMIID